MPTQRFELRQLLAIERRWSLLDELGRGVLVEQPAPGNQLLVYEHGQRLVPAVVLKVRDRGGTWLKPNLLEVFAPGGSAGVTLIS